MVHKIFTIFLAKSEDILTTLSQLQKFFEKGLTLWNSENQLIKSHILLKKARYYNICNISVLYKPNKCVNIPVFQRSNYVKLVNVI